MYKIPVLLRMIGHPKSGSDRKGVPIWRQRLYNWGVNPGATVWGSWIFLVRGKEN